MTREEIIQAIIDRTTAAGLDPQIAVAQAQAESGWRNDVIYGPVTSRTGAEGLFQFMPPTAADYGLRNAFDPIASIDARNAYMWDLLRMFNGDYAQALAGYNWGQGHIQRAVQQYGDKWIDHIPPETQRYVAAILGDTRPTQPPPYRQMRVANKTKPKSPPKRH